MAIVLVQKSAQASKANGQTLAFPSNNTAGNLLILTLGQGATADHATVVSVTDSQGNTGWTEAKLQINDPGFQRATAGVYYCLNCNGGANTVTIHFTGTANVAIQVLEYSNVLAFDKAAGANVSATGGSVAIVTASANELITGIASRGAGGATFSALSPFALEPTGTGTATQTLDGVVTTAQSYTFGVTDGTSSNWATAAAAFTPTITQFGISGSTGVVGALISWTGTASGSVVADGSGNYDTGEVLFAGSYTITPTKAGYGFSPASSNQTIINADITGVNFVQLHGISGSVGLSGAGATIIISAGNIALESGAGNIALESGTGALMLENSFTVTADGAGNFSLGEVLTAGTYTVTPVLTGFTFSPATSLQTINGSDITGVNFTAMAGTYSVPDSRAVTAITPNSTRTVQGTVIYDVPKADSRAAGAPVDCRVAPNIPVDSRVSPNIPQNSRTQPPFTGGNNN